MDPKQVEAVQDWAIPQSVKNIQSCIGFANFYRHFIQEFSKVICPMMEFI